MTEPKPFTYPYPEILTRKSWDKKKGLLAKAAGKTGVGDQCVKVQAAYNKVNWIKLNVYARGKVDLGKWGDDTFSKAGWDKLMKEADAEVLGNLAKLSTECYKLRDVCNKAAAEFKKSKTIPASATQHVLLMAKTADHMGVALNKNTMGDVLDKQTAAFLKWVRDYYIAMYKNASKAAAKRHANLIQNIRKDITVAGFNKQTPDASRDVATGLGNLRKAAAKGFMPKDNNLEKLWPALAPYANTMGGTLDANASPLDLAKATERFEKVWGATIKYIDMLK